MKNYTNKSIKANLLNGVQIFTGRLYFYEDGLEYKLDSVNSSINKGKILYSDITDVKKASSLEFIPNALSIRLKNGNELRIATSLRSSVIEFIKSKGGSLICIFSSFLLYCLLSLLLYMAEKGTDIISLQDNIISAIVF